MQQLHVQKHDLHWDSSFIKTHLQKYGQTDVGKDSSDSGEFKKSNLVELNQKFQS